MTASATTSLTDLRTRHALTEVWWSALDRLTELSVLLHTLDGLADRARRAEVEARLAETRRTLIEVETALDRLRARAS